MQAEELPRRAPRFATDAIIVVGEGEDEARGRCMNLSRGGLCSEFESAAVATGETHTLRLSLVFEEDVESEPLSLKARAVWCTQLGDIWQVGFQFLPLEDAQASFLEMFLRYLEGGNAS